MGTSLRLTVCGAGGAGLAIAADNALKGIDVTLFELPMLAEKLEGPQARGGVEVTAGSETTAGTHRLRPAGGDERRRHGGGRRGRGHDHRAGHVPRRVHGRRRAASARRPDRALQHRLLGLAPAGRALGRETAGRDPRRVQHHAVHLPARGRRHPHRALQEALLCGRLPRRAERRRVRRRPSYLPAVRPGAHGARHEHRGRREPAHPRDVDDPDRRSLLRPLHGRQVLPGHHRPRRASRRRRSTPSASGWPGISDRSCSRTRSSFDRRSYLYEGEIWCRRCARRRTPTGSRRPRIWNR